MAQGDTPAGCYVLGTEPEEQERLRLQHELWRPAATAAGERPGLLAARGFGIEELLPLPPRPWPGHVWIRGPTGWAPPCWPCGPAAGKAPNLPM